MLRRSIWCSANGLEGQIPFRRRAEPSADVSGGRVLARARTFVAVPFRRTRKAATARVCRVGPDDKLRITLGQPFNVPPPEELNLHRKWGIGGSSEWIPTARTEKSIPVAPQLGGHRFRRKDKSLRFTDNQVDGKDEDIVPGKLNWCHQAQSEFRHSGAVTYSATNARTRFHPPTSYFHRSKSRRMLPISA